MYFWPSLAITLAGFAFSQGCAPMLQYEPVQKTAQSLTGYADPFEFKFEAEAVDTATTLPADRLPLVQAVQVALKHDPAIQSALARVRQAEADARQTRLWPNPIFSIALRFPEEFAGKPVIEAGVAADLLSLLTKPGKIAAADQRLRKSTADALVVVLDRLHEVQQAYVTAQTATAQVRVEELRRQTVESLISVTQARVEAGEAAMLDVLTIQGELDGLDAELTLHRSRVQRSRYALAELIGQPRSAARWQLDAWSAVPPVTTNDQDLFEIALRRRPELQAISWDLAASGADLKIASFASLEGGDVGAVAERDGDWTAGPKVSVPLPLFDFGQAERERIRAHVIELAHDRTRLQRQIIREVRIAVEELQSSQHALDQVDSRLIPRQRDRLKQAQTAYEHGIADVLAVRLAEQDLQDSLTKQIELQSEVASASFRLTRAIAGPIPVPATIAPSTTQTAGQNHE